ncbi:MAG: hypothetical protein GXP09_05420 [Gammaproteobacteria bacterium]|nr:hypothetical protein [Gammaproteobacteria bacterium]
MSSEAGHFGRRVSGFVILVLLFGVNGVMAEEKSGGQPDRRSAKESVSGVTPNMVIILPDIQALNQPPPGLGSVSAVAYEADPPGNAEVRVWRLPELMYDTYGDWEVGVGTRRAVGLVVKRPFR